MATSRRVIFLPGVSGDGRFWQPVAERLPPCEKILVDYPGAGTIPHSSSVRSFDDLVALVVTRMNRPVDVVAQSMGGVIAVQAALARRQAVRRLVLTATSGGVDLRAFKPREWREKYRREYPAAAEWITTYQVDLTDQLRRLRIPTLLLWSDADEISPRAVGEHLSRLLPDSKLLVIKGGDHMFARDRPAEVTPHIERHLFGTR
ncbi:MAG: alpha/beta hydrolase [Candidatus Rokuibacteriota bacterium]|nr:MAG: alpha/beta hydrolase [Candidatus Rokubacteria bacterium]